MLVPVNQRAGFDADDLSLDESEGELAEDVPYAKQFLSFIDEATTRYHAVEVVKRELLAVGYEELKESEVKFN
jgi:aspartyl aminopeptidase